jgi:hypothetical protein
VRCGLYVFQVESLAQRSAIATIKPNDLQSIAPHGVVKAPSQPLVVHRKHKHSTPHLNHRIELDDSTFNRHLCGVQIPLTKEFIMKSSHTPRRVAAALLAACIATTSFTSTAAAEAVAPPATGYVPILIPIIPPIFLSEFFKPLQSSCDLPASGNTPWFVSRDIRVTGYSGWSVNSARIRYSADASGTYQFRIVLRETDRSGNLITKSEMKSVNLTAGTPLSVLTFFGNAYIGRAFNLSISHEDVSGPGTLYMSGAASNCAGTSTSDSDGTPGTAADIGYELRGDNGHALTEVVEYYVLESNKYFITGRANEKALLDSMPGSFQRTTKKFRIASKATYGNVSDVYRFYAPAPGANSHVFVDKADRDLINSIPNTGLLDEGADFGTIKPDQFGACPTWAPVKVYRSFRDSPIVGQRNHRYTDNLSDYGTMTAAGWVPEGPVFCATYNF